jgi:hypothetical protein
MPTGSGVERGGTRRTAQRCVSLKPGRAIRPAGGMTYQMLKGALPVPLPPLMDFNRLDCTATGWDTGATDDRAP